ncbi:hypothetical protein ACOMHN_060440 [Nucella lapillus]
MKNDWWEQKQEVCKLRLTQTTFHEGPGTIYGPKTTGATPIQAATALPQLPVKESLADPPSSAETAKALKQTTSGKALGADGIPVAIYKNGGEMLLKKLPTLSQFTWEKEEVPQDFKDIHCTHLQEEGRQGVL